MLYVQTFMFGALRKSKRPKVCTCHIGQTHPPPSSLTHHNKHQQQQLQMMSLSQGSSPQHFQYPSPLPSSSQAFFPANDEMASHSATDNNDCTMIMPYHGTDMGGCDTSQYLPAGPSGSQQSVGSECTPFCYRTIRSSRAQHTGLGPESAMQHHHLHHHHHHHHHNRTSFEVGVGNIAQRNSLLHERTGTNKQASGQTQGAC